MPTSVSDAIDAAVNSVFSKIPRNNGDNLNGVLEGAVRREQLTCTDFETGTVYQASRMDQAKPAYNSLKNKNTDSPQPSKPEVDDSTLKPPNLELFPLDAVQLGWDHSTNDWSVGAGMVNMGNTCYLNSTLQALFHVPALANWLVSDKEHIQNCQEPGGLCIICAMRKTLQESQKRNQTTIRPYLIYNKLKIVGRNLVPGRQEDAHEFLRFLVEAMEKSFLNRYKNHSRFDAKTKETTPLNQILGGYLRSAVRCLKCGHVSTTFQHFQDLLLDIRKAQTLDEALDGYFARETLDDDSYHCSSCQKKVPATKQFSLERAPMVLCVQLKRFSVSNNKITKHVSFRQRLDLTRYARHRPSVPLVYRLVALVTHMGPSVNCGHYTAVAQTPNGNYYLYDDSMVRSITHQAVFSTNAYIMLYELESSPYALKLMSNNNTSSTVTSATATTNINANNNMNNNNNKYKNHMFGSCSSEINVHQQNNMNGLLNNVKSHNNGSLPKISTNFVNLGYTSDKVYGPQLPPQKKLLNGLGPLNKSASSSSSSGAVSSTATKTIMTNGNCSMKNSPANTSDSSSSDSESDVRKDSSSQQKDRSLTETSKMSNGLMSSSSQPATTANGNKSAPCSPHKMQFNVQNRMSLTLSSLSNNNNNNSNNNNVDNNSRNKLQFSSKSDRNSQQQTSNKNYNNNNNHNNSATTRLVPYEPDDSSCSEESNSAAEIESRVSTKAALGSDWKVTIGPFSERSSSQAISWTNTTNNYQNKPAPSADKDDTLSQLLKMSHNGYAAPVSTWNGTRSQLDKEVSNERREERKRMLAENNEDHRGYNNGGGGGNKAKHQKMNNGSIGYNNNNNNNRSNPGYNPMQEYHNHKIWNQNRPGGHYKTFYNPHNRHRRNFHHHNKFQKNYRFGQ